MQGIQIGRRCCPPLIYADAVEGDAEDIASRPDARDAVAWVAEDGASRSDARGAVAEDSFSCKN